MMGIAAYNRGSRMLSAQLDTTTDTAALLLGDLTTLSLAGTGAVAFSPTVIRVAEDGTFWLMNRKAGGWGQRGINYNSLWEIAREYRFAFTGVGRDETSLYYDVKPVPR